MTHFADQAISVTSGILENVEIAHQTRRVRIQVPAGCQPTPGQFFMLRNPAGNDPLIGRALALYDWKPTDNGENYLDLVYVVKGKLTTSLAGLGQGDQVAVWGPLGNGFPTTACEHLIMVAGGIGQTPFLTLAREALGKQNFGRETGYAQRVSFCYGVRNSRYLAGLEQFREAGCEIHIASEDGSVPVGYEGRQGLVTDALRSLLEANRGDTRIVCCGPEPMMEAVAGVAQEYSQPCEVSLETPMACGIGICFTCVAKVGTADDWDYKRTCVEGPVFDACQIQWD